MRSRTILLAAALSAALSTAVAGGAGCTSTTTGNPRAGSDRGPLSWGPDLTGTQLTNVLLDVAQVNHIMGTSEMTVLRTYDQMPGDDGTYSDPKCAGAVFNTVEAGYKGSGYVATRDSQLTDAGGKHYLDQGVVAFGTGAEARTFVATSQDSWRRCVGKHVTYNPKHDSPNTWTIRTPVTTGGIFAAVVDEEGGDGYACVHGITAKSNVVIDVSACRHGMADDGVTVASTITNAIAGKFPT